MSIIKQHRSPNFSDQVIPVEFLVIHYTATDLANTLQIFQDPARQVSSHFVIDSSGETFELVDAFDGHPKRAWHAGKSQLSTSLKEWESFNDFSLGVELVNLNGNIFPYTDAHYSSLCDLIRHLRSLYPALNDPARIIGHEQIAGYRGKVDPGAKFDWKRLYNDLYPGAVHPPRESVLPSELCDALKPFTELELQLEHASQKLWPALSTLCETAVRIKREK